jgi:hypothetical protein
MGQLLERELQKSDPSYQVVNLAISGWDIDLIIQSLELYKDILHPVAIIYVFCPNDLLGTIRRLPSGIYDIEYHAGPEDENAFKAMIARQQPDYWSWNKFYRSSYGKAYHARIIRPLFSTRIRKSLSIDPSPGGYDFPPPIDPPDECTLDEEHRQFLIYCLDRLRRDAGKGNLYIMDTSDKSILYKNDRPDNRRWIVRNFAQTKEGVFFIDFESFVRNTPDGRKFYLDYDDHWSPEGHAAAAELLLARWGDTQ